MTRRPRSGLTRREAERLSDLLAKWTETERGQLDGGDRDAIANLRYLLENELEHWSLP